eukprot:4314500-Pyramimonas_sp.AAC.1
MEWGWLRVGEDPPDRRADGTHARPGQPVKQSSSFDSPGLARHPGDNPEHSFVGHVNSPRSQSGRAAATRTKTINTYWHQHLQPPSHPKKAVLPKKAVRKHKPKPFRDWHARQWQLTFVLLLDAIGGWLLGLVYLHDRSTTNNKMRG